MSGVRLHGWSRRSAFACRLAHTQHHDVRVLGALNLDRHDCEKPEALACARPPHSCTVPPALAFNKAFRTTALIFIKFRGAVKCGRRGAGRACCSPLCP